MQNRKAVGQRVWLILEVAGIALALAFTVTFFQTFLHAYRNDYRVIVDINSIGEAHWEFGVFSVAVVLVLFAVCRGTLRLIRLLFRRQ